MEDTAPELGDSSLGKGVTAPPWTPRPPPPAAHGGLLSILSPLHLCGCGLTPWASDLGHLIPDSSDLRPMPDAVGRQDKAQAVAAVG